MTFPRGARRRTCTPAIAAEEIDGTAAPRAVSANYEFDICEGASQRTCLVTTPRPFVQYRQGSMHDLRQRATR